MEQADIKILAFDLNGTLIGNPDAVSLFTQCWREISTGSKRPFLVYLTGWLLNNACQSIRNNALPEPDYLICGSGTRIYDYHKGESIRVFAEILEEGWDVERIENIVTEHCRAAKRPAQHQGLYKSSWCLETADYETVAVLEKRFAEEGLDVLVEYTDNLILEILPRHADKGNALRWLLRHLKIGGGDCIVAGDSGNDSNLFFIPKVKGIIVGNAQPELYETTIQRPVYHAEGVYAEGVVEGLKYYGVIDQIPEIEESGIIEEKVEPVIKHLVRDEYQQKLTSVQIDYLETAYHRALDALRKNITPMGFSACSLADNDSLGTDANYRSVWARDGAICVYGTLGLDDQDIAECQRNTLITLLNHVSPNGQIPTNVRIDSGIPDYSGVGNICSIDSGIWTVIASFEYVHVTRDLDFLREYSNTLRRAMNWLAAHDGNNDFLLEIPEAGDWTDLFGRSYNILYDEILWYYANFSYGRLLEFEGKYREAGYYLRQSKEIKNTILRKFWPTSVARDRTPLSFTELQSTLGDTRYLVAQVTPFNFNWRCDTYGNILAFLFNVLDLERAKEAFRFMWGVGINVPYPVSNLYPVVSPGDDDWRSYYTVNLLNLPHHYHNGGVWPFIGAQWVRFISRMGFREIALHELLKVAELNQQGIYHEWEFNEWAHGQTGRPMGKAYQAWSAAEFIHACRRLHFDGEE
ncbi:MAG: HAD family hydrolase [Verrucomicrobiota bacterium]